MEKDPKKLTNSEDKAKISRTRDTGAGQKRDIKPPKAFYLAWDKEMQDKERNRKKKERKEEIANPVKKEKQKTPTTSLAERCVYCDSKNIVKRGTRKKKYEVVQLYLCKNCGKTFTPQKIKGRHYPLKLILDSLSFYNLGYNLEDTCRLIKEKYGLDLRPSTLADWIKSYSDLCKYNRLRKFGKKLYSPHQILQGINLYHRQIYKFRIHQAKLALLLQEDIKNKHFWPLREFLQSVYAECPHYLFQEGQRSSEVKVKFNLDKVLIREKTNFANRIANLVLQAVGDNKLRHEALQQFMLCNDSVTVATEVPVYLLPEDIEHMESQLDFQIPIKIEKVLTGHIDLIQLRNGAVHILDYKPNAAKERPIEQLTLYALAMSRLTGLRLFDFKCAWFDEKNYFEFFPLHVVYKLRQRQARVPRNQRSLGILGEKK